MTVCRNERHAVKNLAIEFGLVLEPCKRIALALKLEPMQFAIDDGKVDPHGTGPNAHFLDDARIMGVFYL